MEQQQEVGLGAASALDSSGPWTLGVLPDNRDPANIPEEKPDAVSETSSDWTPHQQYLLNPDWIWSLELGGMTSPTRNLDNGLGFFGTSIEYSPFWLIGFRVGYQYGTSSRGSSGNGYSYGTNTLEGGIPIYFLWFHGLGSDSVFVEPEISETHCTASGSSADQPGEAPPCQGIYSKGLELGYRVLSVPKPDNHGVAGMTLRGGEDFNRCNNGAPCQTTLKFGAELNIGF